MTLAPGAQANRTRESDTSIAARAADAASVPLFVNEEWSAQFPWLIQGTTGRGRGEPFDLGLSGAQPVGSVLPRWWRLRDALSVPSIVLAGQVHGSTLLIHEAAAEGIHLSGHADGHVSSTPGLVLAVTVADCVPVSIVEPASRTVALLHAGWRGTAAGILEAGIAAVCKRTLAEPAQLWVHCGPAICGDCYEVGPEVHAALRLARPVLPTPVDLRAILSARAVEAGIPVTAVSRSRWCTRCDASRFFSYRAGDAGRQLGLLGVRPAR